MDSLCGMFFAFCVISGIVAAIKAHNDAKMLKENPEGWKAMKQHEAEEKERKQRATKSGVETGLSIFTTLFKK
jgi:hypothetical protein